MCSFKYENMKRVEKDLEDFMCVKVFFFAAEETFLKKRKVD